MLDQANKAKLIENLKESTDWIKLFYSYPTTPDSYHKRTKQLDRGKDESITYSLVEGLVKDNETVLVDLGIGTGRELESLKDFKNIKEIVGIDYSSSMLSFCKKTWKDYPIKLTLIKDDFEKLDETKKYIFKISTPKIFTLFFGTINNTTEKQRLKVFRAIKSLMREEDRLIVSFSKLPEKQITSFKHPWIKFKQQKSHLTFYDIQVYTELEWFWNVAKDYFRSTPQFSYDENSHDMIIAISGVGKCSFSHRFTIKEIYEIMQKTGLNIEKREEGNEMYICQIKK
jgi:hypothetical protein